MKAQVLHNVKEAHVSFVSVWALSAWARHSEDLVTFRYS